MRRKCWVFLWVLKARVSWHMNFRSHSMRSWVRPLASNSHRTRMSYDTFGKFKGHPVPHNHLNSEVAKVGRIRMTRRESSGGDACLAHGDQVIRATHLPQPCLHLPAADVAEWALGWRCWASGQGWCLRFCFLFFFNGDNSLLIEISLKEVWGLCWGRRLKGSQTFPWNSLWGTKVPSGWMLKKHRDG